VIAAIHYAFRRQFLALSYGPTAPTRARWWDFLFYVLFGLVVTGFVHVGGVLLTVSYLIVPAVCAAFVADSLPVRLLVGWLIATLGSVVGLAASYRFDLPTGAAIVCALGAALLITGATAGLRGKPSAQLKR
jgi:zinc/manganese transport system permease protein